MDDLLTHFHNLEGLTVAQKRKSFTNFLLSNSHLSQNSQLLTFLTFQLRHEKLTGLEKIFFVDFLIHFRCFDELISLYLGGDEIVGHKLSKEKWFFTQLVQKDLVALLPDLSHSMRLKLVNKLSSVLNEEQADVVFDAMMQRYGVFLATKVLCCCTYSKIESVLKNHPVQLSECHAEKLYWKNPNLLDLYVDERVNHFGDASFLNHSSVVRFVARVNPEMFCLWKEKHSFECKIGKHVTRKMVKLHRGKILDKPELFVKSLKTSTLVRKLGGDFRHLYLKSFRKNFNDVFCGWGEVGQILRFSPKNSQFSAFKSCFDEIFFHSLEETLPSIEPYQFLYVLELVCDAKERQNLAKNRYEIEHNADYLPYFEPESCLKSTQDVAVLTKSCLKCQDWTALLKLLEQLCARHESEDAFFEVLLQSRQVFNNLCQSHWNLIKRILGKTQTSVRIVFKYLEFCWRNDALDEEEICELLQETQWAGVLTLLKANPQFEEEILTLLVRLSPRIVHSDTTLEEIHVQLILACRALSRRHPLSKISIPDNPHFLQSARTLLENQQFTPQLADATEPLICTPDPSPLLPLYWSNFEHVATLHTTLWLLRHRPDSVAENFEKFIAVARSERFCGSRWTYKGDVAIWRVIRNYEHLGLRQKAVDYCLRELKEGSFAALSLLMEERSLVKLYGGLKPQVEKVDFLDEGQNEGYQAVRRMLKSCVNLQDCEGLMHLLFIFLKGDYVTSCVSALQSGLCRTKQMSLVQVLEKLENSGPVSVRKIGFYMTCATQDERRVYSSLEKCHLSQSLALTFQHFVKNPSEKFWLLLKNKLDKLDNNDHFTSLLLVNTPLPKHYKGKFFECAFHILRKRKNRFANVLVDKLGNQTIGDLTGRFFASDDDFFDVKKSETLLSCYLIHSSETERFDVVSRILKKFKDRNFSLRCYEPRQKLEHFVTTFAKIYCESDVKDPLLLKTFLSQFEEIFPAGVAFEEYALLSLLEFKNLNKLDLVKAILNLKDNCNLLFGRLILSVFATSLDKFLRIVLPVEEKRFAFYHLMLENGRSGEDALLAAYLLPSKNPILKESSELYFKSLQLLLKIEDSTIQIYLYMNFDETVLKRIKK